jgi:hypothetical protein
MSRSWTNNKLWTHAFVEMVRLYNYYPQLFWSYLQPAAFSETRTDEVLYIVYMHRKIVAMIVLV